MVGRPARVLLLVLALTGCAIERPAPAPVSLPPPSPRIPLVPPPIISGFGDWEGAGGTPRPWQHAGIDIRIPMGTPVLAAADGTVLGAGPRPNAGRMVLLGHTDDLATAYFHLSEILVTVGQAVRRGEVLGRAGMTGNATTPHLHFGVCRGSGGRCGDRIDSGWEDPTRYWPEDGPCFDAGPRDPPARPVPVRLTYPVGCGPAT